MLAPLFAQLLLLHFSKTGNSPKKAKVHHTEQPKDVERYLIINARVTLYKCDRACSVCPEPWQQCFWHTLTPVNYCIIWKRHREGEKGTKLKTVRAFVSPLWQYCSQLSCKWGAVDWETQWRQRGGERERDSRRASRLISTHQRQEADFKFHLN